MESNLPTPGNAPTTHALAKVIAVDGKLTRSEAMDILLEDLQAEMNAELAVARQELDAAQAALRSDIALEDIQDGLASARIKLDNGAYDHTTGRYTSIIVVSMPLPKGNAKIDAMMARADEARKRVDALERQSCNMAQSKTAFRNSVLKSMLSSTPEGQAALDALAAVRITIRAKMTADPK